MVEQPAVNEKCSSRQKRRDELSGITVKASFKFYLDMLIPWEPCTL